MDRRIIKTKEAIKTAYFSLLIEKNTMKITIAEIARKANIDRKTFYLHYESIDDIVKEITANRLQNLILKLKENHVFTDHFDSNAFFHTINESMEQDLEIHKQIANHPDFRYFWDQIKEMIIFSTTEMLVEIMDIDRSKLNVYARFLAGGITDVYVSWLRKEIPLSHEEVGNIISSLINREMKMLISAES